MDLYGIDNAAGELLASVDEVGVADGSSVATGLAVWVGSVVGSVVGWALGEAGSLVA
jgi:hypothetical protein